ncbi:hypothetical protein [Limosilactobacillus gorillae]|uniref:hypothetical protein n=1 Tax=Limosilactobacillus gorillae TaxID=1450649 RepID=UPI000A9449C4|nr:hypothetical protein [Limosilactobacillus gorillae]
MQVRIVGTGQMATDLSAVLSERGVAVKATTDFSGALEPVTTLVWLPDPLEPVGDLVSDLVALVDRSPAPARIVMHGVVGTADDAEPEQVGAWYHTDGKALVMEHLYAVKMIDELEYPYVIVRTPPTSGSGGKIKPEGQPITRSAVSRAATVALLVTAVQDDAYVNQSVGLG